MTAALFGLVLAGGRSTRMQRDKATLDYHGRSQLAEAFARLSAVTERSFVSVRADQTAEPTRSQFPQIVDAPTESGPLAGILAAQCAHPDVAWLVLACDLPFLDQRTLSVLLAARASDRLATAFRSTRDGLPEPLCALYEPASRLPLQRFAAAGRNCPRKFLMVSNAYLIEQPTALALDNINSADEYWQAMSNLKPESATDVRTVRVQYFALLREQAGRSEESVTTSARSPGALYSELQQRYPFTLAPEMLRVAVNADFGSWTQPLVDGDVVVFIPPVAGG